jgi:hypothetical protein
MGAERIAAGNKTSSCIYNPFCAAPKRKNARRRSNSTGGLFYHCVPGSSKARSWAPGRTQSSQVTCPDTDTADTGSSPYPATRASSAGEKYSSMGSAAAPPETHATRKWRNKMESAALRLGGMLTLVGA